MQHKRRSLAVLVAVALAGISRPLAAATDGKGGPRQLRWDDLVPKGWSPLDEYRKAHPMLEGDSPEGMQAMRDIWDSAPTLKTLDGQTVKLPGYVVPLDAVQDAMREFLLVPYFGACIHSPPPPANQIVHVVPAAPAKGLRAMEVVWVTGVMSARRGDSVMGASGYRIERASIEPYERKKADKASEK
jgi:hypothetical protein